LCYWWMRSKVHKLHQWTQDGHDWYCVAYDHGPMCRQCVDLDGLTSLGVEEIGQLLGEIKARDVELERLRGLAVGLCQCKLDHDGMWPHREMKQCVFWMQLAGVG